MSRTRDSHWSLSRHADAPASSVDLNHRRAVTPTTRTPRAAVARPSPDTRPPPADHRPLTSRHGSRVADHLPTSVSLPVTGHASVWKSGGRPASQEASSFPPRCSRLALRVWKSAALPPPLLASVTITSPQFGASVTASRVGHSARPSRHGTPRLPFPPGLPGSVSGDADRPDLAATPGHHPHSGLHVRLLRRVTGRPLRAVGRHPPPLPSQSQVASPWSPSLLLGRSLGPAIPSRDTPPPLLPSP